MSAGSLNFSQATGVSAAYSSVISGSSSGPVAISGGGVVTLSGANTYTAETDVNTGTLRVDGSLRSSGLTVVNNGGTLGGIGTVGQVRVNSGGHIAPGDVGAGTLTLKSNLTLNSGAKLDFDLAATSASDEIVMPSYTLALSGQQFSDFNFSTSSGFGTGSYMLIDANTVSGSLGSNYAGYVGGLPASLRVSNGNLMLTVVPEPSVLVSLVLGALGLLGYAAARRK